MCFTPNYNIYRTDGFPARKGGTAVAVRKSIPHSHADLPPLVSVEATGVCMRIDNSEILFAAVYKSPGRACIDADIIELLNFRQKSIFSGDLNATYPLWNSAVSNRSREKLLDLFDVNEFEISAPHASIITHLREMVTYSTLWSIRISDCQVRSFLISWTQIAYQ
jgi:hypothetical protein